MENFLKLNRITTYGKINEKFKGAFFEWIEIFIFVRLTSFGLINKLWKI